ncbi:RloB family protein [Streptomyces sp. SHP 1-2]|uniref:RloB family protein n=1 Tax=Streptomyces sp. SHP 1-2 TaxID=2769489 RepID=UPI002237572C|nr:RloB family protein [Streptomyces sp. SHP 1-2]MCW5250516.1 RloB domain-containing protein [Streptomyces sp. SHP 1-2]
MSGRGGQQRRGTSAKNRRRGRVDDDRPLERRPGSKDRGVRVLYVACEGEKTEVDYLNYLTKEFGDGEEGRPSFRIQPISKKNGYLPTETVAAVRRYADADEAWVLFDRDGADRDDDIRQALKEAAASKIEVGFSHPSFDLWLLLHFQPFTGAQNGSSKIIVDKLRSAPAAAAFKDYDIRNDKSVKGARRDALLGREKTAVLNAKALVGTCEHGDCKGGRASVKPVSRDAEPESSPRWSARSGHSAHCPALKRDPSTDVWRLLAALEIVPHSK